MQYFIVRVVKIEVLDMNDNAPALAPVVEFEVEENKEPRAYAYVGKLDATDPDVGENGRVEYALADAEGSELFQVGHKSGEIHLKRALDREQKEMHEFRVVAFDYGMAHQPKHLLPQVYHYLSVVF